MSIRVVAAALGAGAVAAVALLTAGPAAAQTYPPAPNAITVDDPTPARGQVVNVTLTTCRPGTYALIGIDLALVATPVVDAHGAARAAVTIPSTIRPGRHLVSGACLGADWHPLFLTTHITVERSGGGGGGSGGGGAAGGTSSGTSGGGSGTAGAARQPSLDALAGPAAPADSALLYQTTALANGVGPDGSTGGTGAGSGSADAVRSGTSDSGPGALGTAARVALGLAAIGGVPAAMAIGRRPSAAVRSGFA